MKLELVTNIIRDHSDNLSVPVGIFQIIPMEIPVRGAAELSLIIKIKMY